MALLYWAGSESFICALIKTRKWVFGSIFVISNIMAKFKTHMSWGVVIGVSIVVAGLLYSFFSGFSSAVWVFSAVLLGSFLPDLDLDDGVPFQIFFGLLGVVLASFVFFIFYQSGEKKLEFLILFPVAIFVLARFGAGYVFKKFTHHRGMFHSIPAALLAGLLTIQLSHKFSILKGRELLVGLAVTVGYLGHLILDEIYSSVNLSGHSLLPKQSLGSALKFFSSSSVSTTLFYLLIVFLLLSLPETRGYLKFGS